MSQAGNPLPPEPASSGKCVVTLPSVLRQAELLRGVAGTQCSQEAGQLEAGAAAPGGLLTWGMHFPPPLLALRKGKFMILTFFLLSDQLMKKYYVGID